MKDKKNNLLKSNRAVTGIDIVTAVIVLTLFVGVIGTLVVQVYLSSLEAQKSAYAMSYATQILEKVDEKTYDEVDNNFVNSLKTSKEIAIPEDYEIEFSVTSYDSEKANIIKKVKLVMTYKIGDKTQKFQISKLKVKEMGR